MIPIGKAAFSKVFTQATQIAAHGDYWIDLRLSLRLGTDAVIDLDPEVDQGQAGRPGTCYRQLRSAPTDGLVQAAGLVSQCR